MTADACEQVAAALRALWPEDPVAGYWRAYALRTWQPDVARRELEQVLASDPQFGLAHHLLAITWMQLQRVDEAALALERATELLAGDKPSPWAAWRLPIAYLNLSIAQEAQGRFDEALAAAELATQLGTDFPGAHYGLARLADQLGDVERAKDGYSRVLELDDGHLEATMRLAALSADEDSARAAELAARGVELAPNLPLAWRTLSSVRAAASDLRGAAEAMERAAQLDPDDPQTRADLRSLRRLIGR